MSSHTLLLNLARPYPVRIFFNILLGFSGALFNGINTALIVPIILQFLGQEIELKGIPPILKTILAPFEQVDVNYRLGVMLATMLFLIGLKNLTQYISSLVSVALRRSLMNDIRAIGLKTILDVDIDYHAKAKMGEVVMRLESESLRAIGVIITYINAVGVITSILVFLAVLLSISWVLTLISTLLIGIVALVNQLFIRRSKILGKIFREKGEAYTTAMIEVINAMRLIKAVSSEDREFHHLKKLLHEHQHAEFKAQINSSAVGPITEITSISTLVLIILIGRTFFGDQIQTFSAILLIYLVVLLRLLPFIGQLNDIRNNLASASSSVEVVYDFLRKDNKPFMPNGNIIYQGIKHHIKFNNVSFSYPRRNELVLQNISFELPKGTTLALVGGSGAGKSTIADLLARFYDPTQGIITLDDIDLKNYDIKSVRKLMGIVSQDTYLFHDTIRNNVAYAKPDASFDDIVAATKRANAYEFIMELPEGFNTAIGDRGVMLSGGQRQRIAIARALLQAPDILILDEATSALDTLSERLVQQAIEEVSRDRTVLVIAHRLSTIQNADQILVLNKGEVVETGTHEELLLKEGFYRELYAMQFDHKKTSVGIGSENWAQISYQARARLSSILGSLGLFIEGMIDTQEEQDELAQEAYHCATDLLRIIERMEQNYKPTKNHQTWN